jgi:putative aminopeptidase FrvX
MESRPLEFFKKILETPSPSGFEQPVQEIVRNYLSDSADRITTDLHGNVIAVKNPDARFRLMFAGRSCSTSITKASFTPRRSAAGIRRC